MHKHTKSDELNSWVNLEKPVLFEHVGYKKRAIEKVKAPIETSAYDDREIDCMTALGQFYYKTDD